MPRLKAIVDVVLSVLSLMMLSAAAELDLYKPSKLTLKAPSGGGNHFTKRDGEVVGGEI